MNFESIRVGDHLHTTFKDFQVTHKDSVGVLLCDLRDIDSQVYLTKESIENETGDSTKRIVESRRCMEIPPKPREEDLKILGFRIIHGYAFVPKDGDYYVITMSLESCQNGEVSIARCPNIPFNTESPYEGRRWIVEKIVEEPVVDASLYEFLSFPITRGPKGELCVNVPGTNIRILRNALTEIWVDSLDCYCPFVGFKYPKEYHEFFGEYSTYTPEERANNRIILKGPIQFVGDNDKQPIKYFVVEGVANRSNIKAFLATHAVYMKLKR